MRYGKEEITGTITRYNALPYRWQINRTWINLQKASKEIVNSQGFYEIVEATPTSDQERETILPSDLIDGKYVERVRDLSQAEIDERDANELQQQNLSDVQRQLSKANGIALEIFVYIRKHTGLTDNQKSVLKGLAVKLYQGDVEGAIEDFNAIQRPTNANKMQKVYDTLEIKFNQL